MAYHADIMRIDMMVNIFGCTREEAQWMLDNPIQGPPIPKEIEMRRKLGGRPVGRYQRPLWPKGYKYD